MSTETGLNGTDPAEMQAILLKRAQQLALVAEEKEDGDFLEHVVVRLGRELYGIELRFVERIEPVQRLTRIPGLPSFWAGIVNLRGRLYPVLDLREFLDLAPYKRSNMTADASEEQGLVFVSGNGLDICLFVDEVFDVEQVMLADIGVALHGSSAAAAEFVSGITQTMHAILDVQKLLADPRLVVKDR